ncbi:MAG: hypothetical protein EOP02_01765 [Proteobacteria bacterium]|nr:MAG: hypothetical protein EOP02_01765 [Pseudomonadota bacterium]
MASSSVSNKSIRQDVAGCRVDRNANLQPHHGSPHSEHLDVFDSAAHRQIHYLPSAGFQVLLLDLADCQNDEGHLVLRRTLHRAPLHENLDHAAATRLADREAQARHWPVVVCDAQGGRRRLFHERIVSGSSRFGVFVARGPEVDVGAVCGTKMACDVRPLMNWTFRCLDSAAGFVNQQVERPGRSLIHLLEAGSILFVATGLDHAIVYRRAVGTGV